MPIHLGVDCGYSDALGDDLILQGAYILGTSLEKKKHFICCCHHSETFWKVQGNSDYHIVRVFEEHLNKQWMVIKTI